MLKISKILLSIICVVAMARVSASSCASSPCLNGGTCTAEGGNVVCECADGYEGNWCEKVAPVTDPRCVAPPSSGSCTFQCLNNEKCEPNELCCPGGACGSLCLEFDPCDSITCLNGGECEKQGRDFTCKCEPGFSGSLCQIPDNVVFDNKCPEPKTLQCLTTGGFECTSTDDCDDKQVCCSNDCGGSKCKDPVKKNKDLLQSLLLLSLLSRPRQQCPRNCLFRACRDRYGIICHTHIYATCGTTCPDCSTRFYDKWNRDITASCRCPYMMPIATCRPNICAESPCYANPRLECRVSVCGECKARYFDGFGNEIFECDPIYGNAISSYNPQG